MKKVKVGAGAKANHLSYLGDGTVGAGANIGAGTIFCNYDGFDKHETHVGREGAFVGSNSSLVAPVTIGAGAYTGSGSVIARDVARPTPLRWSAGRRPISPAGPRPSAYGRCGGRNAEMTADELKRAAGEAAAGLVEAGMIVGLGTGSTAAWFVRAPWPRARST